MYVFLFYDKNIEKNTYAFIDSIIQSNNHKLSNTSFIDIGGNIGTYSFYFKKKYNTKILIFEPDFNTLLCTAYCSFTS